MIENTKLITQLQGLWFARMITAFHIVAYTAIMVVCVYLGREGYEIAGPVAGVIAFFLMYVDCQRQIDYNIRMLLSNPSFDLKDIEKPYLASMIARYRRTEKRYFSNSNTD